MPKKRLCPKCNKNEAVKHTILGYVECEACQKDKHIPGREPEFTTEEIKQQRREHGKDIVQPWRDGKLSKEYVEAHGTDRVTATKQEIKNASYVWKDVPGWWGRHG